MKRLIKALLLLCLLSIPILSQTQRLLDNANILNDAQQKEIIEKLESVSKKHDLDIVIASVESLDDGAAETVAEKLYKDNNFKKNGVILLVSTLDKEWAISTSGKSISKNKLSTDFVNAFSQGNYHEGFNIFVAKTDELLSTKNYMRPISTSSIIVSLLGGLLIGAIVTGSMKAKLKTVTGRKLASNYITKTVMNDKKSRDLYLYSEESKVKRKQATKEPNKASGKF